MTDRPDDASRRWWGDEVAYVAPMLSFLALIWVGTTWESLYAPAYVARAIVAAALLILFRRHYTRIRWDHWWLGLIVGVIGIFQWVGMQLWLQNHIEHFKPAPDAFNPFVTFKTAAGAWAFIAIRAASAVLVVPS